MATFEVVVERTVVTTITVAIDAATFPTYPEALAKAIRVDSEGAPSRCISDTNRVVRISRMPVYYTTDEDM